jgi:4-amino-4-deoxy-L-arabinose transferase-like glycosyltransferase
LPWRSPPDQPAWARPALLAVAGAAAVLYAWNLGDARPDMFYSNAVRSMTESWRAFWFGAADPAGSITIDKVPGALWPQALSARIFGFHPWALLLPQVIEGVVSVLVLYRVVRRWTGPAAGLVAAGAFACTPVIAVMFSHSTQAEPALTMCLILAADAWQRAAGTARLRSLMLAGVWVGVGFQAKMLEAWAVLPVFAVVYLIVAPVAVHTRWAHVALAGVVTAAVSLSWMAVVAFVPPDSRPFIDGTTNNNVVTMVAGYNGASRLGTQLPGTAPRGGFVAIKPGGTSDGPAPDAPAQSQQDASRLLAHAGLQQKVGWGKLFGDFLASQIGWLYPLALVGMAVGVVNRRGAPRTDQLRGGFLMWGGWLLTVGLLLSASSIPHASYTAQLAAPLAALTGAGVVLLWRAYRSGARAGWLLPAALAVEVAWTGYLASRYASFLPWLTSVVLALGIGAVAVLIVARTSAKVRDLGRAGLVAGLVAVLSTPAAWSLSTVEPQYAGNAHGVSAGPTSSAVGRQVTRPINMATSLTAEQTRLVAYTSAHRDGERYLFATDSWLVASPYVVVTGQPVLPMGGFGGRVPWPTIDQFRDLVTTRQLRYVLVTGFGLVSVFTYAPAAPQGTSTSAVVAWVREQCARAPIAPVPVHLTSDTPRLGTGVLYDCRR